MNQEPTKHLQFIITCDRLQSDVLSQIPHRSFAVTRIRDSQ